MKTKRCYKCGKVKSIKEFSRAINFKDGRNTQCRQCCKEYYRSHKERTSELNRERYQRNKEALKKASKLYYWSNVEKIKKYFKEYSKTPHWKVNAKSHSHNRRALLNSCEINDLTSTQIRDLLRGARFCIFCNKPFDNGRRKTVEHDVPVCRGGNNTLSNVQIACKSCNSKKGRKTSSEFSMHP